MPSTSRRRVQILAGLVLAALVLIRTFVVDLTRIADQAMSPALPGGTHVVVLRVGDPAVGDVVTYKVDGFLAVGRVLAVGGQEVRVRGGVVEVDGEPLARRSLGRAVVLDGDCAIVDVDQHEETSGGASWVVSERSEDAGYHWGPVRVPEGHVFAFPDHRFEGILLLAEVGQSTVEPRGRVVTKIFDVPICP